MNGLLIVAHGSRRSQSNDEIVNLTRKVSEQAVDKFELVDCAFLELAEPLIPDGIEALIKQGAVTVKVLPYFLAKGTHVAEDVPAEVKKAADRYPEVNIEILPYFGTSEELPLLLANMAG